jgi:organic radical activating enzyme
VSDSNTHNTKPRKFLLTELFYSIQGEGVYNGIPSIFVRLFGCNFECNGFSNTDQDGNIGNIEIKQVSTIDELSNKDFTKGCDSRYSWHKDYKHLSEELTGTQIAERICDLLPGGTFELGQNNIHLIFTGGEPLMNQTALIEIGRALIEKNVDFENSSTTIETNGSLKLTNKLKDFFNTEAPEVDVLFSTSPKLSASGEPRHKAWNIDAIQSYGQINNHHISYKFVVSTQDHIEEVQEYVNEIIVESEMGGPVYLMPVGATAEQQNEILPFIGKVCLETGYFLSMRSHVYIFGNELGT